MRATILAILLLTPVMTWAYDGPIPTLPPVPGGDYGFCHCPPRDDATCSAVIWTQKRATEQGVRVLCDCAYGDETPLNPYTLGLSGHLMSCKSGPCDAGQGCTVQWWIKRATNTSGPCTAGCYQTHP